MNEAVSTTGLPVFHLNVLGPKAVKVDAWENEEISGIMQKIIVNRIILTLFIPIHISLNSLPVFSIFATESLMP